MKTREEIRMQFFTENNGAYWSNSQEEPDIDYVHWLEDKLINKFTIPVVVSTSKCYHENHEWKSDGDGGNLKYCNDCKGYV